MYVVQEIGEEMLLLFWVGNGVYCCYEVQVILCDLVQ